MAIGFIVAIVLLAAIVGCIVFTIRAASGGYSAKKVLGVIACAVLVLSLLIVPFSFHTVETGEVAVVKQLGEAKYVRQPGTHFDLWLINSYTRYDTKVRNIDISTMAYSSDAQTMTIAMTMQYQIMAEKATPIAHQYGSLDALQNRIQAIAVEKVKAVLSSHKAMDIIAKRAEMSPMVEEAVRNAIGEEYYVSVVAVVLTNIDFSDAFESAVEEKMIAEQNKLKAEYENEKKVAQAKAEADAKLISAEAEAEANRLLEESLTDKILQDKYLDKWDGKLPGVVAGEDTGIIIPSQGPDPEE